MLLFLRHVVTPPNRGRLVPMKNRFRWLPLLVLLLFALPASAADPATVLPNVVVVTTGGTVAMKYDPVSGGAVPAVSGRDLIAAVPGLEKIASIETVEFSNIDSSQMTPELWRDLSARVQKILERPDVQGVVVTHGTDTMAEAAFFLETTLQSEKPVVFVGAMRSASDLSADGPANIFNAVLQATSPKARGWGVTVTMNQYINSARSVRKDNTTNVQTFTSGEHGYLGYILGNGVIRYNTVSIRKRVPLPERLPYVPLLATYTGDDGRLIRSAVDQGAKGIVIAGFGAGNVNTDVFRAIQYARSKHIPVVVGSQVGSGGVYALYGYEGGGSSLIKAGAYLAGDLSPSKARLLLMLALAQPGMTPEKLQALFASRQTDIFTVCRDVFSGLHDTSWSKSV